MITIHLVHVYITGYEGPTVALGSQQDSNSAVDLSQLAMKAAEQSLHLESRHGVTELKSPRPGSSHVKYEGKSTFQENETK